MSILSKNNSSSNMDAPFLHELKKQASFFFKEKIKTARLALTDVTPAQLLTEEATSASSSAPDTRTLGSISRAAFELEDYWRIVEILHKRLSSFERNNWRVSYNSLVLLEHLLTHGPESAAEEFQSDRDAILEMKSFQYTDERGFNWGLSVQTKSERVLKMLKKGSLWREERDRARKLSRGIQGFGSFSQRSSSSHSVLKNSFQVTYGRSNSEFNNFDDSDNQDNQLPFAREGDENQEFLKCSKENMVPNKEKLHVWNATGESNPLLGSDDDQMRPQTIMEDDHPFSNTESQSTTSLLSARKRLT